MKIRLAVLGCAMWFLSGVAGQEPATELREGFKNPPAKFRPMYITHSRLLTKPEMFDRLVE
ncbi:MAG: hypothetical protein M1436_04740, partial [Acidobacteria bacterium]|nr:hypothetical protein [Acidobacteriota bacterium]